MLILTTLLRELDHLILAIFQLGFIIVSKAQTSRWMQLVLGHMQIDKALAELGLNKKLGLQSLCI